MTPTTDDAMNSGSECDHSPATVPTGPRMSANAPAIMLLRASSLLIASITPKRGFGVAAVITVLLVLAVVAGIVQALADENGHRDLAGYLGAINPITLVDGIQVWLLGAKSSSVVGPPGNLGGVVFVLLTVALIASCYGLLLLRYRKVSAS